MRLTTVLGRIKNPNGHIFRGKNRLVRQVTLEDISLLKQKMELEEKNMFYLRHPYLTPEQSSGHAKALGKHEASFLRILTKRRDFRPNVTIESRLAHLRYGEKWE